MRDITFDLVQLRTQISPEAQLAVASFLTHYQGRTLHDYAISLRILFRWLSSRGIDPLAVQRPHLEVFMRQHLVAERHNQPSTIIHRMNTIAGFYKFAVIDDFIVKSPATDLRLPRLWHDPYRDNYLTRAELHSILNIAKDSDRPTDKALIALLALLGLRISEVLAVQIEDFAHTIDGHRVLHLIGKGAKPATAPLTSTVLDLLNDAAANRTSGPLLLRDRSSVHARVGTPMTYKAAAIAIERLAFEAGVFRHVTPHMFRRGFVTSGLDAGVSLRDMQNAARHSDPRTTMRYDRGLLNLDRHANHTITEIIAGDA